MKGSKPCTMHPLTVNRCVVLWWSGPTRPKTPRANEKIRNVPLQRFSQTVQFIQTFHISADSVLLFDTPDSTRPTRLGFVHHRRPTHIPKPMLRGRNGAR